MIIPLRLRARPNRAVPAAVCMLGALSAMAQQSQDMRGPLEQVTVTSRRLTPTAPGEAAARAAAALVPGGAGVVARSDYAQGRASNLSDMFA